MSAEKIKLKINDYEICPLPTGIFGLDGGAMFGTVPKVLWEKSNPPDEKNRIKMEARALLLKKLGCHVVIDCGNGTDFLFKFGEKLGPKFSDMYNIDPEGPNLEKSLAKYDLKFEDINHVILTHLHFDHAGGGTREKNGKLVPTFPNARYYVQQKNLETAQKPNLREKASYFPANFEPLLAHNQLEILLGNVESLIPGINVYVSNGHTQGQQIVKVSDSKTSLLYCGDVIPTSSHVRLPWIMGYDLNPLLLIEEKEIFLNQAADEKWFLYFEHDPDCDAAQIVRKAPDFAVEKRFLL